MLQHRLVQVGGLVAIVALLTQGAAAQVPSHRTRTSIWQPTDCITFKLRLESPTVQCGYVSMPRRHSDPVGPAIRLATVVIRSEAANRAPEPRCRVSWPCGRNKRSRSNKNKAQTAQG